MTPEENQRRVADAMLEKVLEEHIRRACKTLGLLRYHTFNAKHSPRGFPDDVVVGPSRMIYRELKRQREKPTEKQQEWLDALERVGMDVGVWRPVDWLNGTILAELQTLARP